MAMNLTDIYEISWTQCWWNMSMWSYNAYDSINMNCSTLAGLCPVFLYRKNLTLTHWVGILVNNKCNQVLHMVLEWLLERMRFCNAVYAEDPYCVYSTLKIKQTGIDLSYIFSNILVLVSCSHMWMGCQYLFVLLYIIRLWRKTEWLFFLDLL